MDNDNPFQAPSAGTANDERDDAIVGRGKLYSKGGVLWASFFGAFLGGAFVMSLNYRRLKMPAKAQKAMLGGVVGTIAFFILVSFLPDRIPNIVYTVATLVPMSIIYERSQGDLFQKHLRNKGLRGSNWACVGMGLVSMTIILMLLFGGAFALYSMGILKD
jgi:amino acid transporter